MLAAEAKEHVGIDETIHHQPLRRSRCRIRVLSNKRKHPSPILAVHVGFLAPFESKLFTILYPRSDTI